MLFLTLQKPGEYNVQVSFPQSWNELTTEELLEVCRLQLTQHVTPQAGRLAIFFALLTIRCRQHTVLPPGFVKELNMVDVAESGYSLVEFLYTGNDRTIQPHPEIAIPGSTLLGPDDGFNSLTCGEYEDTEIFFSRFLQKPGHEPLANLAAILYRPGVRYVTIDSNQQPVRYDYNVTLPAFMAMPQHFLYSIFTWYAGCKALLPRLFPTMYAGGSDTEKADAVFTKCIHAGAGPKNGSRVAIRMMLLKEFFFDCEQEAIQAKKMEEEYDKQRK